MKLLWTVLAASALLQAQPQYDLLLKGGHVIDPKNKVDAVRDVAVKAGKIALVSANIPASQARKTVDVTGLYVTPGLVDIHVHVYAGTGHRGGYNGDNSVYPDGHTFRSGVTTVVDAGSSGRLEFADFKDRVIKRSHTRVLAFLNIVGHSMGGGAIEQNLADMDAAQTAATAKANKDLIVGIKTAHYQGPEWAPVDRAVEAGKLAGLPVMVDFGTFRPERPFQELVLKKLRAGDISTHMYLDRVPMLDDSGKVLPYLWEARKRGIIFDAGHGGGSFLFRQAVPAIKQGLIPDSISTDLHITSMNAGMKDMLNVMSKFLTMGLPLNDVILRSTWQPAREIHREELGNLSPGSPADIAVIRLEKGNFGYVDVYGGRLRGDRKLVAEMTVLGGKVMWDLNGISRDDWTTLPKLYGPQGEPDWDGTLGQVIYSRRKKK
jgi:dihydroorotase